MLAPLFATDIDYRTGHSTGTDLFLLIRHLKCTGRLRIRAYRVLLPSGCRPPGKDPASQIVARVPRSQPNRDAHEPRDPQGPMNIEGKRELDGKVQAYAR